MRDSIKILFVEDVLRDAELNYRELEKGGIEFSKLLVENRKDYLEGLKSFKPDIIVSDYSLPQFDGMNALLLRNELAPLTPFIVVTGSVNEEVAVECMKAGADDYIIKEHLTRLPYAVKDALERYRFQAEKKASELLLKEEQEKIQSIYSAAPIGIGLVKNQVFIEMNDTFCQMIGYNRNELIGKETKMIYATSEEYKRVGIEKYAQIAEKGIGSVETSLKRRDGRIINILMSSSPLDKDDLMKGVTFTVLDITDRKLAEENILYERRMLRTLIDNLPDVIYVKDINCRKVISNKADVNMTGYNQEQLILGKTDIELYPNQTGRRGYNDDKNVIRTGIAIVEREEEFTDNRSIRRWLSTTKIPLYDTDGKIAGLVGIGHDITERKRAEVELLQSYIFNESLLKTIPFGMDIVDETGTLLFQSDNFKRIFGEEAVGHKCWEVYRDDKKQCGDCPLIQGITIGETKAYESHGVLNNSIFEISHTGMMYQGKKAMLEIFQDITDRKRSEEELIKAKDKAEEGDKLKTAFLHNISHEIRTPMNAIVGFSALLGEPDIDSQTRSDYIEIIMQSSNHLLAIINDIVDISNIEANLVKIAKTSININTTLKSICDRFIPKAGEKKIQLICETSIPDSEAIIVTDSTKLSQILINLINNAIKFTHNGYVKVSCVVSDNSIEFNVSDTGIGISDEYHQKIFDRFYQVEHAVSRLYEGTGLGLAISKANVELIGGKIWLTSEPGKGASFFFTIPYEKQEVVIPAADDKKVAEGFNFQSKKTILVAEDIDSNFRLISYFLSRANANIIRAVNGKEAVEKFLANKNIDLILMDIKMPVMDGYTAVKLIREKNTAIPIIAQTAYVDDESKAMEAGCSGFISKPFDKKKLINSIQEVINKT
jgi:PAS domain S-box-containing protein